MMSKMTINAAIIVKLHTSLRAQRGNPHIKRHSQMWIATPFGLAMTDFLYQFSLKRITIKLNYFNIYKRTYQLAVGFEGYFFVLLCLA